MTKHELTARPMTGEETEMVQAQLRAYRSQIFWMTILAVLCAWQGGRLLARYVALPHAATILYVLLGGMVLTGWWRIGQQWLRWRRDLTGNEAVVLTMTMPGDTAASAARVQTLLQQRFAERSEALTRLCVEQAAEAPAGSVLTAVLLPAAAVPLTMTIEPPPAG